MKNILFNCYSASDLNDNIFKKDRIWLSSGKSTIQKDDKNQGFLHFARVLNENNYNIHTQDLWNKKDKIDLHQHFFQFYGKNFSPLMAGIIIENCEIIEFSEENKILRINVIDKNFNGGEELYRNLKNEYTLEVIVKKEIVTLEEIKSLYKKELIDQEMETEEFKKVLAKFPNAKIIDIEEIERGDDNDG